MKNKYSLCLFLLLFLSGCSSNHSKFEEAATDIDIRISEQREINSTMLNNILVGNTKISFNNKNYDDLSDGKFTQEEVWVTLRSQDNTKTYLQINAYSSRHSMYGPISGYELSGEQWHPLEMVDYLGIEEEAIQLSVDEKALMYKGRTNDIIFSLALFSRQTLTQDDFKILELMVKGIELENVAYKIFEN